MTSKIKVSELFPSYQGEGRFVGVPSVFLRTFGCNFRCSSFGCDPGSRSTEAVDIAKNIHLYKKYEDLPLVATGCDSYPSVYPEFKNLSPFNTIDQITEKMASLLPNNKWKQSNGNDIHLVITGGEPLLGWQSQYVDLLNHPSMADLENLTFETNGTQRINSTLDPALLTWVTQDPNIKREITFSVSPKLSSSGEFWDDAIKPKTVMSYTKYGHVYLKFVVRQKAHFEEVDKAVAEYRAAGFQGKAYVMPVGGTEHEYNKNARKICDMAMERGYYFSPRLHVSLHGNGWAK
jgi:7-carboxy-7-deazaguanine synthase